MLANVASTGAPPACGGHWTDPERYAEDIERLEFLAAQGWLIVRVSGRQLIYQPETVVRRVREALISRGCPLLHAT
jgi:very-short-patch-repair endonuclease